MATLNEATASSSLILSVVWQAGRVLFGNWLLVLATLIAFYILNLLRRRYASPLRHIPGPFLASMTRAWKVKELWAGHMETTQRELHRKYGPVVRIAPNELSFASPSAARDIFTVGKGFHKTDFYSIFPPPENPDLFTEVDEAIHASKKRTAAPVYSMASMLEMEPYIEATGKTLVKRLDEEFITKNNNKRGSCDLGKWLHFYAFDVLGQVAFSKDFGFLETGIDVDGTIRGVEDTLSYFATIGQVPEYHKLALGNPLLQLVMKPKGSLITEIARGEIQRRKKMAKGEMARKDLLSRLFSAAEEHAARFTEMDVFSIAHGAVFAGSDSTASTMQSTFYHVLRSPVVLGKLLAEIDDRFAAGKLSDPIQYSEALAMPYFQAVLKEAMRMRPGVGISMTRHVPKGGAHIDGEWYPGGTRVGVNAWVVHENKEVFGQDADVFRPERWLEPDSKGMERHLYQVSPHHIFKPRLFLTCGCGFRQFGGGSHLCIGRNLALVEMNKIIPQLFRKFNFRLVSPELVLGSKTRFFVIQTGLHVEISRREKDGDREEDTAQY